MTWGELADHINNMTTDQQDSDVSVYDGSQTEFYPVVEGVKFADPKINDVLDPCHPFIVILT